MSIATVVAGAGDLDRRFGKDILPLAERAFDAAGRSEINTDEANAAGRLNEAVQRERADDRLESEQLPGKISSTQANLAEAKKKTGLFGWFGNRIQVRQGLC